MQQVAQNGWFKVACH